MDYEKAYKDALERARELYNNPNSSSIGKAYLYTVFHELKESEDEKIRKTLLETFRNFDADGTFWTVTLRISKDNVLAWLEKQGEQKPTVDFKAKDWYVSKVDGKIHNTTYSPNNKDEKSKWTDEDANMLDKIVNSLIDSKYVDSVTYNIMYNWLNSIKQRMEEQQ